MAKKGLERKSKRTTRVKKLVEEVGLGTDLKINDDEFFGGFDPKPPKPEPKAKEVKPARTPEKKFAATKIKKGEIYLTVDKAGELLARMTGLPVAVSRQRLHQLKNDKQLLPVEEQHGAVIVCKYPQSQIIGLAHARLRKLILKIQKNGFERNYLSIEEVRALLGKMWTPQIKKHLLPIDGTANRAQYSYMTIVAVLAQHGMKLE